MAGYLLPPVEAFNGFCGVADTRLFLYQGVWNRCGWSPGGYTSVGRLTISGRQRTMTITNHHGKSERVCTLLQRMGHFFVTRLKANITESYGAGKISTQGYALEKV